MGSAKCKVWSVECKVWNVWSVWSVKCGVGECGVESVECGV